MASNLYETQNQNEHKKERYKTHCRVIVSQTPEMIRQKKNIVVFRYIEVKKIRVGRSKNIFILDFFLITHVQRLN